MHFEMPRVSAKELLILELLVKTRSMYGLELVNVSGGQLKRGTVYVTLGRMEEKGFITSWLEDAPAEAGGLPRRLYQVTALGKELLRAWSAVGARLAARFAR